MAKKPQLHEVLAVDAGLKGQMASIMNETITTFAKKGGHFQARRVSFSSAVDDEAESAQLDAQVKSDLADKQQEMVTTVQAKLDWTARFMAKAWDAALQIQEANQRAMADVVVGGGKVIAKDVPATFLLEMEKHLKNVRVMAHAIPTLDPAKGFHRDEGGEAGVYRAADHERIRTKKARRHQVLYDATKEHPAQVEIYMEDVPVGTIKTQEWSGMFTPADKAALIGRVDSLMGAVKKARVRANRVEVNKVRVGKAFADYILRGPAAEDDEEE